MAITAAKILSNRKYLQPKPIAPPTWQEIAAELLGKYGKAELSKKEIAGYLGCERQSERLDSMLVGVPYTGQNTGKRWHIHSVAKAYVRQFQ